MQSFHQLLRLKTHLNNFILGCYYHGCETCEKDDDSPAKKRANAERRKKGDIRNAYIHHYGFDLEIKKEYGSR